MKYDRLASGLRITPVNNFLDRALYARIGRGRNAAVPIHQQARINLEINYHCEFGQQVVLQPGIN